MPSSDLNKMTDEEAKIRHGMSEGRKIPQLNNKDNEKSRPDDSDDEPKADDEDKEIVTLTHRTLWPRHVFGIKGRVTLVKSHELAIPEIIVEDDTQDNGEETEMVTLTCKFQVPSRILEVDGFRVDALDFFISGVVIAYHKRADGSIAWELHGPKGQFYGLLGAFELKDTIVKEYPIWQEEWTDDLPEELFEKDEKMLCMLRNDPRGMLLVYKKQGESIGLCLREGTNDKPHGYFVTEDRQLKPLDMRVFYGI